MPRPTILLSIPGLREKDVAGMRHLRNLFAEGEIAELVPSFPCVTCPVQANMTTGRRPNEHGVVANGFFHRDTGKIEMWTSPADCIDSPQLWDVLQTMQGDVTSAAWFPMHAKHASADYVCTPAPIHNPDGSESLWCYTKPTEWYGTLRDQLGQFPLKYFWGPMTRIDATAWIIDSAIIAATERRPDLFYLYLPHLDYQAQRHGPDSDAAVEAVAELDERIGRLAEGMAEAYASTPLWLLAGEYAITPVDHVVQPNRVLRQEGLLEVRQREDGEVLDPVASRAWALCDHQFSHVFVRDGDPATIDRVAEVFRSVPGIADVLTADRLAEVGLDHPNSGQVVLVSEPNSWQAYYYWLDDAQAPAFARTVDIHRKPGYDPVELHFDPATHAIPLDATLVRGSHGAPATDPSQRTILLASRPNLFPPGSVADVDVFNITMQAIQEGGE